MYSKEKVSQKNSVSISRLIKRRFEFPAILSQTLESRVGRRRERREREAMGEEVAVVRTTECMNGGTDVVSSSAVDGDSVPDHLVVMVHGILGR